MTRIEGLEPRAEGKRDKTVPGRTLCASEGLDVILGAAGVHSGFSALPDCELGLESGRSLDPKL